MKNPVLKTEVWSNHPIRFVEHNGEWWAVALDVCDALGLSNTARATRTLKDVRACDVTISNPTSEKARHSQSMNIIGEKDIYALATVVHEAVMA